jgi:hypothetical protein
VSGVHAAAFVSPCAVSPLRNTRFRFITAQKNVPRLHCSGTTGDGVCQWVTRAAVLVSGNNDGDETAEEMMQAVRQRYPGLPVPADLRASAELDTSQARCAPRSCSVPCLSNCTARRGVSKPMVLWDVSTTMTCARTCPDERTCFVDMVEKNIMLGQETVGGSLAGLCCSMY